MEEGALIKNVTSMFAAVRYITVIGIQSSHTILMPALNPSFILGRMPAPRF